MIVGTALNSSGHPSAFIYQNGEITDLNDLTPSSDALPGRSGLRLYSARAINDRGQIVCDGKIRIGTRTQKGLFLLTPRWPDSGAVNGSPPSGVTGDASASAPPGDADHDGDVDADDLVIVLANMNRHVQSGEDGDVNFDGVVNAMDMQIVLDHLETIRN